VIRRVLRVGLAALVALVGFAPDACAGGGWIPARGVSYLELSLTSATTRTTYDADGRSVPFRRIEDFDRPTTFEDRGLNAYGEFGLGRGWALDGAVAWKRVTVDEPATRFVSDGPADLRLAVRHGLRSSNPVLAISLGASAPLGYGAADYPALGAGEVDLDAYVHGGVSFAAGWGEAELGYRQRGGPAADELPFASQVGVRVHPRWTATFAVRGHRRLRSGSGDAAANFDPALESSSVVLAGPAISHAVTARLGITLQALRTLEGRNMPAGWKWKLAFARSR
jgi:hypothetical protein